MSRAETTAMLSKLVEKRLKNQTEPEMRADYIRDAREMLEIARKAVNE